LLDGALKL